MRGTQSDGLKTNSLLELIDFFSLGWTSTRTSCAVHLDVAHIFLDGKAHIWIGFASQGDA